MDAYRQELNRLHHELVATPEAEAAPVADGGCAHSRDVYSSAARNIEQDESVSGGIESPADSETGGPGRVRRGLREGTGIGQKSHKKWS